MTPTGQGCCARCGTQLRRGRGLRGQVWCDPCRRAGPDPRRELPAGFYLQDPITAALIGYDFGTVFRRVRARTGWSQQTLADLVGLDQTRISAIERGVRRLRDVALVAQIATGLCIPPVLLGFGEPGTTVGQAGGDGRKWVSWMDRRDFVQQVAALALGVTGMAALDIDRLTALLPHADPTGDRAGHGRGGPATVDDRARYRSRHRPPTEHRPNPFRALRLGPASSGIGAPRGSTTPGPTRSHRRHRRASGLRSDHQLPSERRSSSLCHPEQHGGLRPGVRPGHGALHQHRPGAQSAGKLPRRDHWNPCTRAGVAELRERLTTAVA